MYIPPWPSLNPAYLVQSDTGQSPPYPLNSTKNTFFYVARNGIYHLFRTLRLGPGEAVLVPDYHHGNEIYAMRAAGVSLRYYPVMKNLDVDLDAIRTLVQVQPKARALYVTHFIGWPQPMTELRALCREKGLLLIEDCALSFLSEYQGQPLGTFGDYSVFCLYKSVPVPNGGILVRNVAEGSAIDELTLQECSLLSVAGRSAELMLQWFRSRHSTCGKALFTVKRLGGWGLNAFRMKRAPVGDTGFNVSAANIAMSSVCHTLLRRFHYDRIKETRRRNYRLLEERLRGSATFLEKDLGEGVCPLFFPLFVGDKPAAARALWRRGIEAIEFWNQGDPEAPRDGYPANFLRRHLLEIPIHQDVTHSQIEYMADQIRKLRLSP